MTCIAPKEDFLNVYVHPLNFLINDLLNHMGTKLLIMIKTSEVSTESNLKNTFMYLTDHKLCAFKFSLRSFFIFSKAISFHTYIESILR